MDILHQWNLVVAAFDAEYRVALDDGDVRRSLTWRWFAVRVSYLLAKDNPLARHFGYRTRLEQMYEAVHKAPEE